MRKKALKKKSKQTSNDDENVKEYNIEDIETLKKNLLVKSDTKKEKVETTKKKKKENRRKRKRRRRRRRRTRTRTRARKREKEK